MLDQTCNGYENWETAIIIQEMNNNRKIVFKLPQIKTAQALENFVYNNLDLLQTTINDNQLKSVNWGEVSDAMKEE